MDELCVIDFSQDLEYWMIDDLYLEVSLSNTFIRISNPANFSNQSVKNRAVNEKLVQCSVRVISLNVIWKWIRV